MSDIELDINLDWDEFEMEESNEYVFRIEIRSKEEFSEDEALLAAYSYLQAMIYMPDRG